MSKTVLITGVKTSLDAAIARAFAADGYRVALQGPHTLKEGQTLVASLAGNGHLLYSGDLKDIHVPASLVNAAMRAFGRLDCVVCSASMLLSASVETESTAALNRYLTTNLLAPISILQAIWRLLKPPQQANIVLVTENRDINLSLDYFGYTVSSTALHGCCRLLAAAAAPRVRVNMVALACCASQSSTVLTIPSAEMPLKSHCPMEGVVDAVLWLAQHHVVTGQFITVDSQAANVTNA